MLERASFIDELEDQPPKKGYDSIFKFRYHVSPSP
jgi:hypothetical protein